MRLWLIVEHMIILSLSTLYWSGVGVWYAMRAHLDIQDPQQHNLMC